MAIIIEDVCKTTSAAAINYSIKGSGITANTPALWVVSMFVKFWGPALAELMLTVERGYTTTAKMEAYLTASCSNKGN